METRVIDTPCGPLEGAVADGVAHYGAVPYARPPVGDLRFALPRPVEPWQGVLDATHAGPVAPQLPSRLDKVMGIYPARQDEDCLRLEIWAPEGPSEPRAVMVFVHGGGFMTGGGALPCYDAALLARRFGVVVVNVSIGMAGSSYSGSAALCRWCCWCRWPGRFPCRAMASKPLPPPAGASPASSGRCSTAAWPRTPFCCGCLPSSSSSILTH
ncbi:hypothetical protein CSC72_02850 [Pusillimonas noertemannii]|nr:hypothetical protein CSC72_02850 [Pusillimonas noertemannii]